MQNKSPFVIKLLGTGATANSKYLLLELNNCGTLADLLKANKFLKESVARAIMTYIALGL